MNSGPSSRSPRTLAVLLQRIWITHNDDSLTEQGRRLQGWITKHRQHAFPCHSHSREMQLTRFKYVPSKDRMTYITIVIKFAEA